jgi:hypothetical protein
MTVCSGVGYLRDEGDEGVVTWVCGDDEGKVLSRLPNCLLLRGAFWGLWGVGGLGGDCMLEGCGTRGLSIPALPTGTGGAIPARIWASCPARTPLPTGNI